MDQPEARERGEQTDEMSIFGAGITVTGNIEAPVDLDLQGKVLGDVRCLTLILGEQAEIRGSVFADRVRVCGIIEGSVETKDLAVEANARIVGDVTYSRIKIANGGIVDGKLIYKPTEEEEESGKLRLVEPVRPSRQAAESVHIE
jgi:cytoskeletal protein CcmA (bactofilin family)